MFLNNFIKHIYLNLKYTDYIKIKYYNIQYTTNFLMHVIISFELLYLSLYLGNINYHYFKEITIVLVTYFFLLCP